MKSALDRVGLEHVTLDVSDQSVRFRKAGVQLDFGGIGKGFALDRAAEILREFDVTSALLHGGKSTVLAIGTPPGRDWWTVDIRHPYNAESVIERIRLRDASVSTSGCYGDLLEVDGQKICNIFDPRNGLPVTGTLSATAVCPTATESDALSTAFLVLGLEGTKRYCGRHATVSAMVVPEPDEGDVTPHWFGVRVTAATGTNDDQ